MRDDVETGPDDRLGAVCDCRGERLRRASEPRHEPVCELEHLRGRAVAPLEAHHPRVREALRQCQQPPRAGAGEAVDRLVVVPDRAELVAFAEPEVEQRLLEEVDVLVLVHREGAPAVVHRGPRLVVRLEQPHRPFEQVLEVELPLGLLPPLVLPEDAAQEVTRDRRLVVVEPVVVRVGGQPPVLRPLDLRCEVAGRPEAVRHREPVRDPAQQQSLRGQDPARIAVEVAEQRQRGRVEGRGPHPLDTERLQPLAQLTRRLVGERHGHDLLGREGAGRDLPRDAARDRGRLSRPRPGKDAERAARRLHGVALLWVQACEDRLGVQVAHASGAAGGLPSQKVHRSMPGPPRGARPADRPTPTQGGELFPPPSADDDTARPAPKRRQVRAGFMPIGSAPLRWVQSVRSRRGSTTGSTRTSTSNEGISASAGGEGAPSRCGSRTTFRSFPTTSSVSPSSARRSSSASWSSSQSGSTGGLLSRRIFGCDVSPTDSSSLQSSSFRFSPGFEPVNTMRTSRADVVGSSGRRGSLPDRRIMFCARSMIRTGSPMSSTNTWPRPPIAPACTTSETASGIVMKYRVISGWVTVTGPPRSICLRKIGITLPDELRTLPKRTATKRVATSRRCPNDSTIHSQRAFDCPITVFGLTALSVEMKTNRSTPNSAASSTRIRVPTTLFRTDSSGCVSSIATCLYAAAWNTTVGWYFSKTSRRIAFRSLTSMSFGSAAVKSRSATSSRSISNNGPSALSTRISRDGRTRAIWRQSSEPIEPPAPLARDGRHRDQHLVGAVLAEDAWQFVDRA